MLRKPKIFLKMARSYFRYKIKKPSPFSCTFYLTFRCNLKCSYCPFAQKASEDFEIAKRDKKELSTEKAKYVIDQIAKTGVSVLSLTGGEPLLREDLEEIALYAQKKNMLTVLHTNATLISKERAEKIGKAFDSIVISLAGKEKTNDKLRGRESFKEVIKGVDLLKKYYPNSKINLNFLLSDFTFEDIDYIVKFAKENFNSIAFLPGEYFSNLLVNKTKAEKIERKLIELKKKNKNFISNSISHIKLFKKHLSGEDHGQECDAWDLYFSVSPKGEVAGCSMWPYSLGNILKEDIGKIRKRGKREKRKLISRCGGCLGTIRVSLLFRRPFYSHISSFINISPKVGFFKK